MGIKIALLFVGLIAIGAALVGATLGSLREDAINAFGSRRATSKRQKPN